MAIRKTKRALGSKKATRATQRKSVSKKVSPKKASSKPKKTIPKKKSASSSAKKSASKKSSKKIVKKSSVKKSVKKISKKTPAKKSSAKKSIPKKSSKVSKQSKKVVNRLGERAGKKLASLSPNAKLGRELGTTTAKARSLKEKHSYKLRDFSSKKTLGGKLSEIDEKGDSLQKLLGKGEAWAARLQGGYTYKLYDDIRFLIEDLERYNIIAHLSGRKGRKADEVIDDIQIIKIGKGEQRKYTKNREKDFEATKERRKESKRKFRSQEKRLKTQSKKISQLTKENQKIKAQQKEIARLRKQLAAAKKKSPIKKAAKKTAKKK